MVASWVRGRLEAVWSGATRCSWAASGHVDMGAGRQLVLARTQHGPTKSLVLRRPAGGGVRETPQSRVMLSERLGELPAN